MTETGPRLPLVLETVGTSADVPAPATLPAVPSDRLREACVVGAGLGHLGSELFPTLAQAGVGRLVLIDRDRVEPRNLANQRFRRDDLGRYKAEAIAEQIRQSTPESTVTAILADLEDVPMGVFEGARLIVGCLDSRRARVALGIDLAWVLGIPWIDGAVGVVADGLIGRVLAVHPGPDSACLLCTYSQADYRLFAAEYPCSAGGATAVPPSGSPGYLGKAVAARMAVECLRALLDPVPAPSHEIAFDLHSDRILRSTLRRSPRCHHDHEIITTRLTLPPGPEPATAADLLRAAESYAEGRPFALRCRRGIAGATPYSAYLEPDLFRRSPDRPLAAFGFEPDDLVRISVQRKPTALLRLHPESRVPSP